MKYICLDLRDETSLEEMHDVFKVMLDLPEYYGENYNALYDEITSISENTEIKVIVKEADVDKWETLRRVLADAASVNKHILLKGEIV